MKKILFIPSATLPFPPVDGGAVQNLIDFLIEDNEKKQQFNIEITSIHNVNAVKVSEKYRNCKVHYLKINESIIGLRDKQIKYFSGKCSKFVENKYLKGIKKLLKNNEYDFVIFENTQKYAYLLKPYLGDSYKILHLHNDYLNSDINKSHMYANEFDKIICISKFIEQRVNEITNVETTVIYNGIDTKRFIQNTSHREKIREKLEIDKEDKVILFSGRMVKEKGILELIRAFNKVNSKNKVILLIIGSRVYGKNVTDDYSKEVLELVDLSCGKIKLTGYINYDEINQYYAACDIGALPTMWEEPLSLSVIEYLSAGMPVLISNSGGMVELVNNKCGFIINKGNDFIDELANKIEIIINNKELYLEYSKAAQERAKSFDKSEYCLKMWNYINGICIK